MGLRILAAGLALIVIATPTVATEPTLAPALQARPRASLWYRGLPPGVPRQEDLHAIQAAGFTAVTWPNEFARRTPELRTMAERAGLELVIRAESIPMTSQTASVGNTYADLLVSGTETRLFPALMWRAIAHGSRVISFDPGVKEGTGLVDAAGKPPAWLGAATAVARQLSQHAVMVDTFSQGPPVKVDPPVANLDIKLIDAVRSWVIIATNTASAGTPPADTFVFLPKGVPPAEWLNLFDGSTIAMLRQTTGPRWHIVLGPGDVRVYAIGKVEG